MNNLIESQVAIDALMDEFKRTPTMAIRAKHVIEQLPPAQSEIIYCKDCEHRPVTNDAYDFDEGDCGFNIEFPDHRCPCQCEDAYYNKLPDDDWFCGNAERRKDGQNT